MRDKHQPTLPPNPEEKTGVDASRRRFAKAGIGTGAVLATVASRSVLAAVCATPSVAGSGNESTPGIVSCAAPTPDSWVPGDGIYGTTSIRADHKFFIQQDGGGYFTSDTNFSGSTLGNVVEIDFTIADALARYDDNESDLAAWAASALISAEQGVAGAFGGTLNATGPDPSVFGIMDEFARLGYFKPTGTVSWREQEILWYFQGHDFN